MTTPDPIPEQPRASASSSSLVAATLASLPWRKPLLAVAGTLVISEGMARWVHLDGVALLGLGALAGGWWWLGRSRAAITPRLPVDVDGWIERCRQVLPQFERLAPDDSDSHGERCRRFDTLLSDLQRPELAVSLVGRTPPPASCQPRFAAALRSRRGLRLQWGQALPVRSADWCWPVAIQVSDLVIYHLNEALSAADLRWLEALPEGQPVWLLLQANPDQETNGRIEDLCSQWPALQADRALVWDGRESSLPQALAPLSAWLQRGGERQRSQTAVRVLEQQHRQWQADLEALRLQRWQGLQQRTQWIVAAGVLASPLPSLDLLVLAAANGLMLQEMAELWDCHWELQTLQAAASELARSALALGLVEWSSQALLSAARLHGATWLVGGVLQALSAAYLTRVVGHAMADVLALSSGVTAPDLAEIRRQAPLLVSRAAEAEKLDWSGFLAQGRQWLQHSVTSTVSVSSAN
ncbi:MAG: YcjF family protein [Cyanobium sp.]